MKKLIVKLFFKSFETLITKDILAYAGEIFIWENWAENVRKAENFNNLGFWNFIFKMGSTII